MSVCHRTPEQWHLPTPFRDSSGGRITIPVSRPSLHAIPFLIGLGNVAAWLLFKAGFQDHGVTRLATYTACALAAWTMSGLMRRYVDGERIARACGGTVVVAGCWFAGASTSRDVLLLATLAAAALATVAAEVGFRISMRRKRRRAGVGPAGGR